MPFTSAMKLDLEAVVPLYTFLIDNQSSCRAVSNASRLWIYPMVGVYVLFDTTLANQLLIDFQNINNRNELV